MADPLMVVFGVQDWGLFFYSYLGLGIYTSSPWTYFMEKKYIFMENGVIVCLPLMKMLVACCWLLCHALLVEMLVMSRVIVIEECLLYIEKLCIEKNCMNGKFVCATPGKLEKIQSGVCWDNIWTTWDLKYLDSSHSGPNNHDF